MSSIFPSIYTLRLLFVIVREKAPFSIAVITVSLSDVLVVSTEFHHALFFHIDIFYHWADIYPSS